MNQPILHTTPGPSALRRGAALLLVMWAMFVMSFSIMGIVQLLRINIDAAVAMERLTLVSMATLSGVSIGQHPEFPANGRTYHLEHDSESDLVVRAVTENSKLKLQTVITEEGRPVLEALFSEWGLTRSEISTVVDCLLDFVEPGDLRRLNGAKRQQYRTVGQPNLPPGRPFVSIDEMSKVMHFDLVTRRNENWHQAFTLYGDGKLDLNSASPDLIKAVTGAGDPGIRSLIREREAMEGGLADLEQARLALGFTEKEFSDMKERVRLGGDVRRVLAVGSRGGASRSIEAVFDLTTDVPRLLQWKER